MQRKYIKNPNIRYLLIALCFSISSLLNAQFNEKKSWEFEQKLNNFKYSLYPILDTIPEINNLFLNTDTTHLLIKKIKKFVYANKSEIIEYQNYKLNRYTENIIEFDKYELDSVFFESPFGKATDNELAQLSKIMGQLGPLGELFNIDPFYFAMMFENAYLAQIHSVAEVGLIMLKERMARPKVKTKKLGKKHWQIWIDHYSYLSEFDLVLDTNVIKFKAVYKRSK